MTNFDAPIPVSEIESILAWVDTFKLSRCTRKINRDFSDAVLLAEILFQHYPKLIEMHNYPSRNSHALKLNNWMTLNRKVLKKLKLNLCYTTMEQLANATPGYIERLLIMVRDKIYRDEEASKVKEEPLSSGGSYHEALGDEGNVILIPVKNRVNGVLETVQQKVINYNTYLSLKEELRDAKEANDTLRQKVEQLDRLLKIKEERVEELQKQLERKATRRKEVEALIGLSAPDLPLSNKPSDQQIIKKQVSVKEMPSKTKLLDKPIKTSNLSITPDPLKPNEKTSKSSLQNTPSLDRSKVSEKHSRISLNIPSETAKLESTSRTSMQSARNGSHSPSIKGSRTSIPVANDSIKLVEKPSAVFYIPSEETVEPANLLSKTSNYLSKEESIVDNTQRISLNNIFSKIEKPSVQKIEVQPREANDSIHPSLIEVKELKKSIADVVPSTPKLKEPISNLIYFNEAAKEFDLKNAVYIAPPSMNTTVLNVPEFSHPTDVIPNQNYVSQKASRDDVKSVDRVNSDVFEDSESVEDMSQANERESVNERESEEFDDSERDLDFADDEDQKLVTIEDSIKKEITDITDSANKIDQSDNLLD